MPHSQESSAVSILTPVLNAAGTLREALQSALSQHPAPLEVLVQDGGSVDGSTRIWSEQCGVEGVVEKDSGIYDAMNRLLRRARGDWVVFLQADDWLEPGALAAWMRGAAANPSAQIISGGATAVELTPEPTGLSAGQWRTVWERDDITDKKFTPGNLVLGEPMLNARLYRRESLLKAGGFDVSWRLASDRDLLIRLWVSGVAAAEIPERVYRYRWHRGSRTFSHGSPKDQTLTRENIAIAKRHWRAASVPELRVFLKKFLIRETVRLAMNGLEAANLQWVAEGFAEGSKTTPGWVLIFVAEFVKSLLGWAGRGFLTRSQLAAQGAAGTRSNGR